MPRDTPITEVETRSDIKETVKVLVIDDDRSFLQLISRYFEEYASSIDLITIRNPEEALNVLEENENQIDCILSDYRMPEMNGVELLRKAKSEKPEIPFIIVTSEGDEEIASEAIKEGVTDYIKKGESTEDYLLMIKRVKQAVLKKEAERERLRYKKELERKLDESREINQSMINSIDNYAIFQLDKEGYVKSWNSGAKKIKGYTENEILGEHFSKFYTEEDRDKGRPERNLEKARKNGKARDQSWRVRKDGTKFWGDVTIRAIEGPSGQLQGFIKITKDMTERHELEEEMRDRLEEFGSLASHDLRGPLNTAKSYLDLGLESENMADFRNARCVLDSMSNILDDLEIIAMTSEDIEKEELRLYELFSKACDTVVGEELEYESEKVIAQGERSSLLRLFRNLVENSIEHNEDKVKIQMGYLENENGFYYEDTGKGISDKDKRKVLEKGFTTSSSGQGLGLYVVKRITNLHGWEVDITDSSEGGARFEFYT